MSDIAIAERVEEVAAETAYSWWLELATPYTEGLTLSDWVTQPFRDVVCFQRYEGAEDAYLVRRGQMIHFGFDHDTLESAYEALGPQRLGSSTIVRRMPWRSS